MGLPTTARPARSGASPRGGGRRLITLDTSGVATEIGKLSDGFAGIAFAPEPVIITVPAPATGAVFVLIMLALGALKTRHAGHLIGHARVPWRDAVSL
jgi:hypothetical protein